MNNCIVTPHEMDCFINYRELPRALDEFKPDMVVYNAGTDILKGDPLGVLDITPEVRVSFSPSLSAQFSLSSSACVGLLCTHMHIMVASALYL